ncbi:MAG TPA: VWA domain-containing protein [Pyrinomonadaceae bacterium]|nr:VWA domain-containing protein [Chloracidobacterium sp.]HRA42049.1 VWA domain-containing protein [Pyrinomonadaceae bacterium]
MSSVRAIAILILLTTIATVAFGQDDDPIRVDSSIVRLNVGVVDGRGRPMVNLDRSNFTIYEDGVKQQITRFEPSSAPFSVVMILDMSGSTLGFRQVMKQSAFRFVDALTPQDRVAVIEFYDKVNVRNDFTTDRRTIGTSIELSNGRGKTQLFKAIDLALEKLSGEKSRRKAIIVLSDGIDTAVRDIDREQMANLPDDQIPSAIKPETSDILQRVLNKADRQGVTIYPLALPTGDPAKLADPTLRQVAMYKAARARLQIIADRTGGVVNTINRLEEMGTLYAKVAADLRTLYTIEYQPINEKRDGKWRTITLETSDTALISRTKTGYFAK